MTYEIHIVNKNLNKDITKQTLWMIDHVLDVFIVAVIIVKMMI